jgi:hypothetical protein
VASTLLQALFDHPLLVVEALLLGAATLALPAALQRGLWGIALLGATLITLGLLLPLGFASSTPSALAFVLCTWALCAVLAATVLRRAPSVLEAPDPPTRPTAILSI